MATRLATLEEMVRRGDVVGSRVPPPRNITELGGINLLPDLGQSEMRQQALSGILGMAGPSMPLSWASNDMPLAFVGLTNDRPTGAAQPSIPLNVLVRSDFAPAVQAAQKELHQRGATLPLSSPPMIALPKASPGATAPADILRYLGRTLDLAANAALLDPTNDPLALIRKAGSADQFQIAARVLTPGAPVPVTPGDYDALKCSSAACTPVSLANASFVPVGPILAAVGYYPVSPLPQPTSLSSTAWAHFTNVTGLVSRRTGLGDELSMLYSPDAIAHSVFASMLTWAWNGTTFVS
jgi:hypothetical protein